MKTFFRHTLLSLAGAALVISPLAQATNGYFTIGAGSKNRGMAGAGIAFGQDAMAPAVNPASLSGVGTRVDAGVELFKPKRSAEVDASGLGVPDLGNGARQGMSTDEKSRASGFFVPHFGIAKAWTNRVTLGLSVAANGGMNTRYGDANSGSGNLYTTAFAPVVGDTSTGAFQPGGPSGFAGALEVGAFGGAVPAAVLDPNLANLYTNPNTSPALGVNLAQVLVTPTIAYKIDDHNSIGFSPVIGYQSFRAYGLGLFQAFSSNPGKVTNNGNDNAYGFGAQVGYMGTFGPVSIGATARSKIYMDEFNDYSGLFAEQGDFDIPPTFGVGLAVKATSKLTLAADVSRILYSEVASISNKGPTANEFFGAFIGALTGDPTAVAHPLGSNDGWGFGWDDVWVYKLGVDYAYNSDWTFRAGFNYAPVPYNDSQALFNVLAPAVVEKHVTAGFTRSFGPRSELTVAYMHAFRNDVEYTYEGSGPFTGFSYSARNDMYQDALEVSYGLKF
jgi:long-chain fatty acid transport protein